MILTHLAAVAEQVLSLTYAKLLFELPLPQHALYYWAVPRDPKYPPFLITNEAATVPECNYYAAFTVAELGILMHPRWRTVRMNLIWGYGKHGRGHKLHPGLPKEADTRALAILESMKKRNKEAEIDPESLSSSPILS